MSDTIGTAAVGSQPDTKPKVWRDLKPDAQAFDEVRIVTVPRFKESGLSGDDNNYRLSDVVLGMRTDAITVVNLANGKIEVEI